MKLIFIYLLVSMEFVSSNNNIYEYDDQGRPIPPSIEELKKLLETDNRNIYIHCYGGHGRTGLVLVNLIQSLFEVNKDDAMYILSKSHKQRGCRYYCSLTKGRLESSTQEKQTL